MAVNGYLGTYLPVKWSGKKFENCEFFLRKKFEFYGKWPRKKVTETGV